jgi:hypothetical protein
MDGAPGKQGSGVRDQSSGAGEDWWFPTFAAKNAADVGHPAPGSGSMSAPLLIACRRCYFGLKILNSPLACIRLIR